MPAETSSPTAAATEDVKRLPTTTTNRSGTMDNDAMTSSPSEAQGGGDALGLSSQKWWTDEEEKRVRRKLDWNILAMLFLIYGAAYIDRSNIGNAKTAGMNADLGISDIQYRLVTIIFVISYILFQWLLLFYLVIPAHIWVASCASLWGVASALQGAATGFSGLMAARWFVGMAEAGFGTGIALYLGFFYPRQEIGYRFAWFVTSSAVASAIAGAIAYGLVRAHAAIAGWRLLFIVEGTPSIIVAAFIFFFLPDGPKKCRFLNEREKLIADARLFKPPQPVEEEGQEGAHHAGGKKGGGLSTMVAAARKKFDPVAIKAGLLSPVAWLTALQLWVVNVGYGSIPIFLPTILKDSGFTAIKAQGYTAPPYLCAWVFTLVSIYISDKMQHRAVFNVVNFCIGASGYILLAKTDGHDARYGGVFLVALGLFPMVSFTYIYLITNVSSQKARGIGLTILGTVSQTGPLVGQLALFPATDAPYYRRGMWTSAGISLGGVAIALTLITVLVLANRKRDLAAQKREQEFAQQSQAQPAGAADEEKTWSGAASEAQRERLAAKVNLDTRDPLQREEALRRYIDCGQRGEDSPYFRYVI